MFNPLPAFAGLLDLFGKWARRRPQVSLIAEPFLGGQRYLYFVVRNPRKVQIRLTSITVIPAFMEIWRDDSEEAAAEAWDGIPASAFIDPGAKRLFPVSVASDLSAENQEVLCSIIVRWRSMRHPQIPCVPAIYRTTVATLEAQRDNKA